MISWERVPLAAVLPPFFLKSLHRAFFSYIIKTINKGVYESMRRGPHEMKEELDMATKTIKDVIGREEYLKIKAKAQKIVTKAEQKVQKMYADYLLANFAGRHFRHLVEPDAAEVVFVTVKETNGWTEAVLVDTKKNEEFAVGVDALFDYYEILD